MDLVAGTPSVTVITEHTAKDGRPKIVTDLAVFDVSPAGLVLRQVAPGLSLDDIRMRTGTFTVELDPRHVSEFSLP
ncbi:MAG: putative succinyl-CoA:3-ketoacid coenzyme transferase subunit [Microbacteriaceae bacterium]|jgi:3-oxoacid CoA-transferase subunit B|nr:putative succinyl-CoA:3-ketoacid coenzyme transferase subunit [Microbacteriaceae bacterium]